MKRRPSPTLLNTNPSGAPHHKPEDFPPLESITRPNLTTDEIAHYTNMRPQTWRCYACKGTGPIKPLRIGARLNWPTQAVRELVGVA
jgi:hypothetical protein